MTPQIGVLDYGAGNLRSVLNAFATAGHEAHLVTHPEQMQVLDLLVFPGQGAFGDSVAVLKQQQLWQPLRDWLAAERPYLGICLGYQLLFESSEESPAVEGLGMARGVVRRFPNSSQLKVPHMGWNEVQWQEGAQAYHSGIEQGAHFYFVHSYYPEVQDESEVLCRTQYGVDFACGIVRPRLMAVQFHPEKSQALGLQLLRNAVAVLLA